MNGTGKDLSSNIGKELTKLLLVVNPKVEKSEFREINLIECLT